MAESPRLKEVMRTRCPPSGQARRDLGGNNKEFSPNYLYVSLVRIIDTMQPKRGRNEIIRSILEVCLVEGAVKTRIVYQANLNFRTVRPYLASLVDGGMLEVLDQAIYRTTEKGSETLRLLKEIDDMIP